MPGELHESFSRRHGFKPENPAITIWEDAPEEFRLAVLEAAKESGLDPHGLRAIVCKVLRKKPDPGNWTAYPNVWNEVQRLVENCDWFRVYDIAEAISCSLAKKRAIVGGHVVDAQERFEDEVNSLLVEFGIGWKIKGGYVQARGEETYEAYLKTAEVTLDDAGKSTALTELKEAIKDISRRPSPDSSGAIQHAMAALECVARDATNDPKPTLGKLMQKHRGLFPKPVDDAVEKLWGYASENARHGREGNEPTREEAMLIVGVVAALSNYLMHKFQ